MAGKFNHWLLGVLVAGCTGAPSDDKDACVGICDTETDDPDDTDADADTDADSDTDTDSDADSDADADADSDADADTDADSDADSDADADTDTDTDGSDSDSPSDSDVPSDTDVVDPTLSVLDVPVGGLVVTEVMVDPVACSDVEGEYVEILNTTDRPIDLTGLRLGNKTLTRTTTGSAIIQPGEHAVGARTGPNCYGLTADFTYDLILFAGDDRVVLSDTRARVIDTVAYTTFVQEPGRSLMLAPGFEEAVANDTATNWCPASDLIGAGPDRGTPGFANPECVADVDTDTDPSDPPTDAPDDTGTGPVDDPNVLDLTEIGAGGLIITEVMITPAAGCGTANGQYLEIYNPNDKIVDLTGLMLSTPRRSDVLIRSLADMRVNPGEFAYVVRNGSPRCFLSTDRGFYWDSAVDLRAGDVVQIYTDRVTFDAVFTEQLPAVTGRATGLDPSFLDAQANDNPNYWCTQTPRIEAGDNRGTPRATNTLCGVPDFVLLDEALPGDLVLTEVMADPSSDCEELNGEYIEVYNRTEDRTFDLSDLILSTTRASDYPQRHTLVYPGTRVLLAPELNTAFARQQSTERDRCFPTPVPGLLYDGIELRNSNERVTIATPVFNLDTVDFSAVGFREGRSVGVLGAAVDAAANDAMANWCDATIAVDVDWDSFGSPGRATDEPCVPLFSSSAAIPAAELTAGSIVVTEVFADGEGGDYFEVYNAAGRTVDLNGLRVGQDRLQLGGDSDGIVADTGFNASAARIIDAPEVAPGALLVVYLGEPRALPGVASARLDAALDLASSDDRLVLANDLGLVDAVRWTTDFPFAAGASITLTERQLDAGGNDYPGFWCASATEIGDGTTDRGSPGALDFNCQAVSEDTGAFGVPGIDTGAGPWRDIRDVPLGDLLISEVMVNAVGCSIESSGNYLEIYNRGDRAAPLRDLELWFDGVQVEFATDYVLPAGRAVVIGPQPMEVRCSTYEAPELWYRLSYDLTAGSEVEIRRPAAWNAPAALFDRIDLDDLRNATDVGPGRSINLTSAALESCDGAWNATTGSVCNDDVSGWCSFTSGMRISADMRGTWGELPSSCEFEDSGLQTLNQDEILPGTLLISEIMSNALGFSDPCRNRDGDYVELYNAGEVDVQLRGLRLETIDAETGARVVRELEEKYVIEAGEVAVGTSSSCAVGPLANRFPVGFQDWLPERGRLELWGPAGLLDAVDYAAWPGRFNVSFNLDADRVAELSTDDPALDDFSSWCRLPDATFNTDFAGSPGELVSCPALGADAPVEPEAVPAGSLVITELNVRPNCFSGDFIELRNVSQQRIQLRGFDVRMSTGSTHEIVTSLVLDPGSVAWGASTGFRCASTYGEPNFKYVEGRLPTEGWVEVGSTEVMDRVDYVGWSAVELLSAGDAWQLGPDFWSASGNDASDAWCPDWVSPNADRATPGYNVLTCLPPPPPCPQCESLDEFGPGDLVLTEFMLASAACPKQVAQYFEFHNQTDRWIDPNGLVLVQGTNSWPVAGTYGVPPHSSTVVRRAPVGSQQRCFPDATDGLEFNGALVAGATSLQYGRTVFDSVDLTSWVFAAGASLSLDPDARSVAGNDDYYAWCVASDPIVGSDIGRGPDLGTPSEENPECLDATLARDAEVGDLVITEVLSNPSGCAASSGQWFEVYNASESPIDLRTLVVGSGIDGREVVINTPTILDVGAYIVFGPTSSTSCPGSPVRVTWPSSQLSFLASGDVIYLATRGRADTNRRVLDQVDYRFYTAPDADGDTELLVRLGASLQLDAGVFDAAANDRIGSWCHADAFYAPGASANRGSPGRDNVDCGDRRIRFPDSGVVEPDERLCLAEDTGEDTSSAPTYVPCNPDAFPEEVTLAMLAPGDLVITEIMVSPSDCGDINGEYIEVENRTPDFVALRNLLVSDGQRNLTLVTTAEFVEPLGRAVLYAAAAEGCWSFDGPLSIPYEPSVVLNDNGDSVAISYRSPGGVVTEFDRVDFTDFPRMRGVSWQVDPSFATSTRNDAVGAWCPSTSTIDFNVGDDLGTPGLPNADCGYVTNELNAGELVAGDLMITEIMVDPLTCPDRAAEWFEITNLTGQSVNLRGVYVTGENGERNMIVRRANSGSAPVLPAGGRLVLARASGRECLSFQPDAEYPLTRLRNDGGRVALETDGAVIDEVVFDGWLNLLPGVSLQLDPIIADATLNDFSGNWCPSSSALSGGLEFGTPGVANTRCLGFGTSTAVDPVPLVALAPGPGPTEGIPGIDDLRPGDLVIEEWMADPVACNDGRGEYLEVRSLRDTPVDLGGLVVRAGGEPGVLDFGTVLNPGQLALLMPAATTPCYDADPDGTWRPVRGIFSPGTVSLQNGTEVIASWSTGGFQGLSGVAWTRDPQGVDCPAASRIGASLDRGTPGEPNANCYGEVETRLVDTADTGDWRGDGSAASVRGTPVYAVPPGSIVISEVMGLGRECTYELSSEWVEITNRSSSMVDLANLYLQIDNARHVWAVERGTYVIPPGASWAVRPAGPTPCSTFPQPMTGYGSTQISDGAYISIGWGDILIDQVVLRGYQPGASFQLDRTVLQDPEAEYPFAADAWCPSVRRIPTSRSDLGTPGALNLACDVTPEMFAETGADYVQYAPLIGAGDLVITEFLVDADGCGDAGGEFIEVYNASGVTLQLDGVRLAIDGTVTTVRGDALLAAGDYAWIRPTSTVGECYAREPDYRWEGPTLPNDGGTIRLESELGTLITELDYTPLPRLLGRATAFTGDVAAPTSDPASWCAADTNLGPRSYGTPGSADVVCFDPEADPDPSDTGSAPVSDSPEPGCPYGPSADWCGVAGSLSTDKLLSLNMYAVYVEATELDLALSDYTCARRYRARQIPGQRAEPPAFCEDCEWGFGLAWQTAAADRVDLMTQLYPGQNRTSVCPAFARVAEAVGGPSWPTRIAYSSADGGYLLYELGGAWRPYSYEVVSTPAAFGRTVYRWGFTELGYADPDPVKNAIIRPPNP